MSRRKKIIIIVAIILGIFALIVLLLSLGKYAPLFERDTNLPPVVQGSLENLGGTENIAATGSAGEVLTASPSTQSTIIAIAMTFAERFGSFSNEGNYENLTDLKTIMTENMARWTDSYIKGNKIDLKNFYGVTTRALNAEIITLTDDEKQAQLLVTTQRQELGGDAKQARIFYQKILLNMKQPNDSWKVDSATWQ